MILRFDDIKLTIKSHKVANLEKPRQTLQETHCPVYIVDPRGVQEYSSPLPPRRGIMTIWPGGIKLMTFPKSRKSNKAEEVTLMVHCHGRE